MATPTRIRALAPVPCRDWRSVTGGSGPDVAGVRSNDGGRQPRRLPRAPKD